MSSMKINRTEFMKLNVMAHMREQKYHTVLDRSFRAAIFSDFIKILNNNVKNYKITEKILIKK